MKPKFIKSITIILQLVESKFNVQLRRKARQHHYVVSRFIFYKLCRDFTFCSLSQIGEAVNRNHATVLHGLRQFDNFVFSNDKKYLDPYNELKEILMKKLNVPIGKDTYFTIDELIEQNEILSNRCEILKSFIEDGLLKEYDSFFALAKKHYGYEPHHAKEKYKQLNQKLEKIL
jgi:hypothetical protein